MTPGSSIVSPAISSLQLLNAEVGECLGLVWWQPPNSPPFLAPEDTHPYIKATCNRIDKPTGEFIDAAEYSSCPIMCDAVKAEIRRRCLVANWDYGCSIAHTNNGTSTLWLAEIHTPDGEFTFYAESEYEAVCRVFVAAVRGTK